MYGHRPWAPLTQGCDLLALIFRSGVRVRVVCVSLCVCGVSLCMCVSGLCVCVVLCVKAASVFFLSCALPGSRGSDRARGAGGSRRPEPEGVARRC